MRNVLRWSMPYGWRCSQYWSRSWALDYTPATSGSVWKRQQRRCLSQLSPSAVRQSGTRSIDRDLSAALQLVKGPRLPCEGDVTSALEICYSLAKRYGKTEKLIPMDKAKPTKIIINDTPVVQKEHMSHENSLKHQEQEDASKKISDAAYDIIAESESFISQKSLELYVTLQAALQRPYTFPKVFDLYACKPVPKVNRGSVVYKNPNPEGINAAIPLSVASAALQASIEIKSLPLCLSIIDTTVSTRAFRRAKFFRKALVPCVGLGFSPLAAYALGKAFSEFQERLDPQIATAMGTIGFLTYFGMTSMLGYVAITTSNDQMVRVTWATGTPLYQRWLREEERSFIDQVALAWGFEDPLRYGEEGGEDWDNLRTWIVHRDLILDNPAHMEGME